MTPDPDEVAAELAAFPPALRALLDAEMGAGNAIDEIGHSHPAPPRGAYVRLVGPLATAVPDGLDAYERNGSSWSTEVTDDDRAYWGLGAPLPPPPEPDMDAIREAANRTSMPAPDEASGPTFTGATSTSGAWDRFRDSMSLDYERWREGIGIDLDALDDLDPDERVRAEAVLLSETPLTWREIEALAHLGTPRAEGALRDVLRDGRLEDRLAVLRHAPHLLTPAEHERLLVDGVAQASALDGHTQLLLAIQEHHPPAVLDALAASARDREGDVAIHDAAMLDFLEGPATEAFDWDHRPFYLRFWAEPGSPEREEVWRELCVRTGRDPGSA